jgi:hypothetical protein
MKKFFAAVISVGVLVIAGAVVAQTEHGSGHDMHGAKGQAGAAGHEMMKNQMNKGGHAMKSQMSKAGHEMMKNHMGKAGHDMKSQAGQSGHAMKDHAGKAGQE